MPIKPFPAEPSDTRPPPPGPEVHRRTPAHGPETSGHASKRHFLGPAGSQNSRPPERDRQGASRPPMRHGGGGEPA
jgi:hypothetical protein